jgi:hypothetical protein
MVSDNPQNKSSMTIKNVMIIELRFGINSYSFTSHILSLLFEEYRQDELVFLWVGVKIVQVMESLILE